MRLQLKDTAGLRRFRALLPSYVRDATVAVIVFDVCGEYRLIARVHIHFLQPYFLSLRDEVPTGTIIIPH